jgi:hypothetical protein
MPLAGYLGETCRLWLLVAVIMAAGGKSIAFARFRSDLMASFPELGRFGMPLAFAIVAVEWLLAALLLSGGTASRYGLIGAAVLFAALTLVVAAVLVQDRTVVCSCFGAGSHRMSGHDLLRNGLLIGAAVFAALSPPPPAIDVLSHVALLAIATIAFQLSTSLQEITALLRIKA